MNNTEYSSILAASSFVSSTLLLCFGALVIIVTLIIVNNLIMKFWKPMGILNYVKYTILDTGSAPKRKIDKTELR